MPDENNAPVSVSSPHHGASSSGNSRNRRIGGFEKLVLFHFGILLVGTSWGFGGEAPSSRLFLFVWGTVGMGLFVCATWLNTLRHNSTPLRGLLLFWPLWIFDLFVALSCLNPTLRETLRNGEPFYELVAPPYSWLPSSARPDLAFRQLWLINGIVLSSACLLLALRSHKAIRLVLFIMAGNGLALAIFGTFQKLVHSKGLWFGLVHSPQPLFFSTFVYHNHWAAFTLINTAACLGLLFHYLRRGANHRNVWHSPAFAGAVGTFLLAASVPLSASRSGTLLLAIIVAGACVHFLQRAVRKRREFNESIIPPVAALAIALLLATIAIFFLSREIIGQRSELTVSQVNDIRNATDTNARLRLYADTWRMASDRIWFGWGLQSYAPIFIIYNSSPTPLHGWRTFYANAHNDWLQSLAEVGVIGTSLLLLLGLTTLRRGHWRRAGAILPYYLLGGCTVILLYAVIEFPLANPAVLISFWTSFFCAVRYTQIDQPPAAAGSTSSFHA